MSSPILGDGVPEWDLADRMRKALRSSGIGVQDMADYLGVARNTVSTWINGKITPTKQTQRLWALRTGVPFEWLSGGAQQPTLTSTDRYWPTRRISRNEPAATAVASRAKQEAVWLLSRNGRA